MKILIFLLAATTLSSCKTDADGAGSSRFYLTTDGRLYLSRTTEKSVHTCDDEPATGTFIKVSYTYKGQWYENQEVTTGGGYFIDDRYVEFSRVESAGDCEEVSSKIFPEKVTVPYLRDLKFVSKVGIQSAPAFADSVEEWIAQNNFAVCAKAGKAIAASCKEKSFYEQEYAYIKSQRNAGKGVPVFETLQADARILKLEIPLDVEGTPEEIVLDLEKLPQRKF